MPKILIVDNEWPIRLAIEGMLTNLGYDVAGQAETGMEAVAMALELNPDLILMDVKMPGEINGIDAAREIKAELGTPIVFISGYCDPEHIEAAKDVTPFGYVMKPFGEKEIHAFVEIALSRRKLDLKLEEAHEQLEQANLDLQSEMAARKKTETALQESQKLYRNIFEKNNAMKWLLDPSSGKIIDANPATCEFYQYSYEEITKLRLWDINIESEANVRKLLADASSDGNTEFTFKHRLASGEIRDVQVYTGALVSGEKKLLHSIIIDITDRIRAEESLKHAHDTLERRVESRTAELEKANKQLQEENEARKRTEEALRESEEHHRSFMQSAKGFIVYRLKVDHENYFSGRLIFVSPGIEDEVGASPEAEFSEWFSHVHPDDLPGLIEVHAKSARNGDTFDQEFRWGNLKGEWEWYHAISNPVFDSDGKPKYYNGMAINITAQKQAEKALQESEKDLRGKGLRLEELNTALKILLEKGEKDREELEEKVMVNVKEMVLPYVAKLKSTGLDAMQETFTSIIESNLDAIISPFLKKLSSKYLNLTPTEIRVADLVKQGLSTKEIGRLLNSSPETISRHRKSIRKKLQLKDKKSNLRTHLLSLQ